MTRKTRRTLHLLGVRPARGEHDADVLRMIDERGVYEPWTWVFGTVLDEDPAYVLRERAPSA